MQSEYPWNQSEDVPDVMSMEGRTWEMQSFEVGKEEWRGDGWYRSASANDAATVSTTAPTFSRTSTSELTSFSKAASRETKWPGFFGLPSMLLYRWRWWIVVQCTIVSLRPALIADSIPYTTTSTSSTSRPIQQLCSSVHNAVGSTCHYQHITLMSRLFHLNKDIKKLNFSVLVRMLYKSSYIKNV